MTLSKRGRSKVENRYEKTAVTPTPSNQLSGDGHVRRQLVLEENRCTMHGIKSTVSWGQSPRKWTIESKTERFKISEEGRGGYDRCTTTR